MHWISDKKPNLVFQVEFINEDEARKVDIISKITRALSLLLMLWRKWRKEVSWRQVFVYNEVILRRCLYQIKINLSRSFIFIFVISILCTKGRAITFNNKNIFWHNILINLLNILFVVENSNLDSTCIRDFSSACNA